jgi:hypothetical protein
VAIFRTLRDAVRVGGRVVVETNHRDLTCARIAHGAKASKRLPDGALFLDESDFDAISGVHLNWHWSGPGGSGERHAEWHCYTPTQIIDLLGRAGLRFTGAYKGLSKTPYRAEGPEAGGPKAKSFFSHATISPAFTPGSSKFFFFASALKSAGVLLSSPRCCRDRLGMSSSEFLRGIRKLAGEHGSYTADCVLLPVVSWLHGTP